jgi:hypothetical protein
VVENPVRLKYAESDNFSPGGGITGVNNTKVTAKVKNIAFAKDVAIHYAQADQAWGQRPLSWQKTFTGYDLFIRTDNTFSTTEFVIRYTVSAQTFWDNNGGANYHVDSERPNTVGGNVILNKATARRGSQAGGGFVFTTSWVEGESSSRTYPCKNTWASGFRLTEARAFMIPMHPLAVTSLWL